MKQSIQFIFDLEEQGRLFHFDDDPAQVVNWHTGAPVFKPEELPAIRAGVARCFATAAGDHGRGDPRHAPDYLFLGDETMRKEIDEKFGPYAISLHYGDNFWYVWDDDNFVHKKIGDDWKKVGVIPECTVDGRSYLNHLNQYLGTLA